MKKSERKKLKLIEEKRRLIEEKREFLLNNFNKIFIETEDTMKEELKLYKIGEYYYYILNKRYKNNFEHSELFTELCLVTLKDKIKGYLKWRIDIDNDDDVYNFMEPSIYHFAMNDTLAYGIIPNKGIIEYNDKLYEVELNKLGKSKESMYVYCNMEELKK